jgi:hypothetical protein
MSQHPVGHPRDRSGNAGTLRTCFILRFAFAPRLFWRCRDLNRRLDYDGLPPGRDVHLHRHESRVGWVARETPSLRCTRDASHNAGPLVFIVWTEAISLLANTIDSRINPPARDRIGASDLGDFASRHAAEPVHSSTICLSLCHPQLSPGESGPSGRAAAAARAIAARCDAYHGYSWDRDKSLDWSRTEPPAPALQVVPTGRSGSANTSSCFSLARDLGRPTFVGCTHSLGKERSEAG